MYILYDITELRITHPVSSFSLILDLCDGVLDARAWQL